MVCGQSLAEGLDVVVGSLDQWFTSNVINHGLLGRVDYSSALAVNTPWGTNGLTFSVVTPARGGVDQSAGNTTDQELVRDLEFERLVELLLGGGQHRVELFGLNDGSGESVEDEARIGFV